MSIDCSARLCCHLDAFMAYVLYTQKGQSLRRLIICPMHKRPPAFEQGFRHDALGKWPVVELDPDTALPRDWHDYEVENDAKESQ